MITTMKDYDGKIIAHVEWRVVGQSGYDMENGEYLWISDLWIHESFRNSNVIRKIIDKVMNSIPDSVKYGYFQRLVHNEKKRIYSRNHFERMRLKGELIT
jgi:hypothetical protein